MRTVGMIGVKEMAKLTPVVIDFETYWSVTHSLTKMNPIAYVMHPDTEIISCAAKVGDEATCVTFGEDKIRKQIENFDWSDKIVIGHNMSGFDAMILAWRFGVRPKMWGCTLAMARPHHALTTGLSLAKLVEHYSLGVKDQSALMQTKGRHLCEFTPQEIASMGTYNKADVEQCAALFNILLTKTPKWEMKLIDMTVRMLVEPKFDIDAFLLASTLEEERKRKQLMLVDMANMLGIYETGMTDEEAADAVATTLGSAPKFSQLLRTLHVEVPMKPSPTNPDKQVPALAKTDEAFLALKEHDDPIVAAAAHARLGVKSTLLESRIESFLEVSNCMKRKMPIALNYYAAHTGRWGGALGLNQQNLPRVSGKPTDALRNCLRAPKGYKVVVSDLSGIELRVNHFLWQVESSMSLFKADPEKADLYKAFAGMLYGVPVGEVNKAQRQIGKIAHLGLGFGAGAKTFVSVAKTMGGVDLTEQEAANVVAQWRSAYPEIVAGWKRCHQALSAIDEGAAMVIDPWGLCETYDAGIKTPRGAIRYPELAREEKEWKYGSGRNRTRIYAGRVDENLVQHIARCILAEQALEIQKQTGHAPVLTVHDELVYIVPEDEAEAHLRTVYSVMRAAPAWWPELVLWAEGDIADSYGAAK